MLRHFFTTALHNITQHRLYSAINIIGLAVGLTSVILISLFIRDEVSFDKWVPNSANLYRLEETFLLPGRPPLSFATTDFPLAALLKDHLPEVTAMTRFWPRPMTITVGGHAYAQSIVEVDPEFFRIIHLSLAAGDPADVLSRPDSIVLSQTLARKFFGDANPVGRTLSVNRRNCPAETIFCANEAVALRVSGVIRDLPHNTQLRADAIIPHMSPANSIPEENKRQYFNLNGFGYVRLAPGADPVAVAAKVPALLDQHVDVMNDLGMPLKASKVIQVHLTSFSAVHLEGDLAMGEMVPAGSRTLLFGLGVIGLVILLVACFNFTNLATARAMVRAREIALRKCCGAPRGHIIVQFMGESVLVALFALVMALSLVELILPTFDGFLARPISFHYLDDWAFLALMIGIAVAAGLAGGAYPALLLSRFLPAPVLRASGPSHTGSSRLRTVLVVLQFAVTIGLAAVTLVVYAQLDFVRHQNLGFRRDGILIIQTGRSMSAQARDTFVTQLMDHPGVLDVAVSGDVPFSGSTQVAQMRVPGHPEWLTMDRELVTPEFFRLYDMRLLAGRMLTDRYAEDRIKNSSPPGNDGRNILVSKAAAARFGFTPQAAVGKIVLYGPSRVQIVGVVADTRVDGARQMPRLSIYLYDRVDSNFVSVRIAGDQTGQVLDFVDRTWHRLAPNVAVDRNFLDQGFADLYSADQRQGVMFGAFVAVSILIACLGLFGLAAFTVGRRTREMGIRKAFGAHKHNLIRILLWQFSVPVLLANLLAWPLAWYFLREYLQSFADHIALSPLYFAAVSLATLLIAWASILVHALNVSRANPIHALRYE